MELKVPNIKLPKLKKKKKKVNISGPKFWMSKGDAKDKFMTMLPFFIAIYIFIVFLCCHMGHLSASNGGQLFYSFMGATDNILENPFGFLPINQFTLRYIAGGTFLYAFIIFWISIEEEKNKRDAVGEENGSAKFNKMDARFKAQYVSPHDGKTADLNNVILSNEVAISLDCRKTMRNLNVLVIGGSGSGKTRFFVKPNLLQANTSYVITDPSGELLATMGVFLEEQGYQIKVFNLTDMKHSCCYNPFDYIRDAEGVAMLVNCLIKNTTPAGASKGDPFWEKSETALLTSLISYLIETCPDNKEKCNFTTVMKLLRMAEVDENNPNAKSKLDMLMDDLGKANPHSLAVKDYTTFKMGAGKTLKSILISCAVRLHSFDLPSVEGLIRTDVDNPKNNIDFNMVGDEKTALFIIISAADDTFNFLASMLYYQLFETIYYNCENKMDKRWVIQADDGTKLTVVDTKKQANTLINKFKESNIEKKEETIQVMTDDNVLEDKVLVEYQIKYKNPEREDDYEILLKYPNENTAKMMQRRYQSATPKKAIELLSNGGKAMANHINFLLDEFANIGQIPDFDKKLATMRKYEISCCIILQNMAQLKEIYDKKTEGLVGNCDEILFLGSPEQETCEYFSKKLGDATITVRNASRSLGGGKKGGGGANYSFNKSARKLLTPDEVGLLQKDCLVFIRAERPFMTKKYDYGPKHQNYKYTADADPDRTFFCSERFNTLCLGEESESEADKDKILTENDKNSGDSSQSKTSSNLKNKTQVCRLSDDALSEINDSLTGIRQIILKLNDEKKRTKEDEDESE